METQENYLAVAEKNLHSALEIINELQIVETWKKYNIVANLIGSVPTGLLMKNKDIDFHVYSDCFSIRDSFNAITEFALNPNVKRITYDNLLETEEKCLEWHMIYQDKNSELWQIDIIHILKGSFYDGRMEKVTKRIKEILTPEMKNIILSIKNCIPDDEKIMGIEIYMAVIRDNIKNYREFLLWREKQNHSPIIDWIP